MGEHVTFAAVVTRREPANFELVGASGWTKSVYFKHVINTKLIHKNKLPITSDIASTVSDKQYKQTEQITVDYYSQTRHAISNH